MNECQNSSNDENKLLEPYHYIMQCSGKKIRTKLIQAFNHWLQIPDDKLEIINTIIEMLHNSRSMILKDNATLRRGIPVAHNIFGIASTINSANYVYFLSADKLIKEFPSAIMPKAITIFTEQLLELHRGQGMDIYWRDSYTCPSEEQYIAMIERKTGALFSLGVKLMQLFSADQRDFSFLITLLGKYFQIRDDYANLKSATYEENKSYCEDLTEGKFSFPIIHGILSNPNDKTLINILRKRTTNVELKKFAVEKLESFGSFEYTMVTMKDLSQKAREEVDRLGGNKYLHQLLNYLETI
ncbi:geranylgeranyl pyrophosphate synthase-like [Dermatophagoides farinae]|uniref:Geranylgeranyl pyrophosphate synthase-like n=1 Tax=Dermatophagoides farinae TaxID=6954 RepID=A0A9D4NQX0_DERFA|nr:geranylgeranyl pyrophosphate synthase-like [Dermatophagoides farinae]